MNRRSRPRRHQRRTVETAIHNERAVGAVRWANRAFIGSTAAWVLAVAGAWIIVSLSDAKTFVWGLVGPSKTGSAPLEFDVQRAEVPLLAAFLLALPIILAVLGWFQTRDRTTVIRQDGPVPLSMWSRAGAVAALALVPNLLGCFWLSATGLAPSSLMDLAQAWPYIAAVFVPIAWVARGLFRSRFGAL